MTNLVAFSHNEDVVRLLDGKEYTYYSILNQNDDWWENCYNHIQILFPTNKPSLHNKNAPILTRGEAEAFCKHNLKLGLWRFYDFLCRTEALEDRGHNDLRVTRAVESAALILGKGEALEFLHSVLKSTGAIESLMYSDYNKCTLTAKLWLEAPLHSFSETFNVC